MPSTSTQTSQLSSRNWWIECGQPFMPAATSSLLSCLHALHHLTQLKSLHLKVHSQNRGGDAMVSCLLKSPCSLQHLKLEGTGSHPTYLGSKKFLVPTFLGIWLTAGIAGMLSANMQGLENIELKRCRIVLAEGLTPCFSNLTRLSLNSSFIHTDAAKALDVTRLTNLVHLDISNTTWFDGTGSQRAIDSFVGWPALRVLDISTRNSL